MKLLQEYFVSWLAEKWIGTFVHSYPITASRHWRFYRDEFDTKRWACTSISDALTKYSWASEGYASNKRMLDSHALGLQQEIGRGSEVAIEECCRQILQWGGVKNEVTVDWLTELRKKGELGSTLSRAVGALKAGELSEFRTGGLLMNSGMTKIYSLADASGSLIIYDGRVGAALGYLVTQYLTERGQVEVPDELGFMWGGGRPTKNGPHHRDPSFSGYRFRKLGVGEDKGFKHAEMVVRGTRLIQALSEKTGGSHRDWEAALFMIGYELPPSA